MDESGFHDDPGKKKLLFRRDCKHPDVIKNSSKSCFTIVFCGNAAGELIPPFFIFKGVKLWSDWLYQAPESSRMAISKSGWMETTIFEDWLENQFIPFVKKDEGKKILMCDNLSAHISPKALRLCAENNIAFICLIPNSTHLLQPLDVGYFSAVKSAWRKVLNDYRQTCRGKKVLALPKSLFAQLIKRTLQNGNANSSENLRAGFKSCGLYPLSPATVLNKLPAYTSTVDISDTISESFVNYIENVRQSDLNTVTKGKKFQLPVVAGKSVSAEEVENYYKEREKTDKTKRGNEVETRQSKKRGRPMGSKNKNKKKPGDPTPSGEVWSTENENENNEVVDAVKHGEECDENELMSQNVGGYAEFVVEAMIHKPPSPEVAKGLYKMLNMGVNLSTPQEQEFEPPVITIPGDNIIGESEEQIQWEDKDLPIVEEYVVEPISDLTPSEQNNSCRGLVKDAYCIFNNEGSMFLGQIRKLNLSTATVMVSAFQKSFLGGWKWPSKAEILKVKISDIVSIVKDDQITKKNGITYVEDDILLMEWGE
ncbi:unnamed protein product [Parnassius mnemosyne]|uniref:DDE-1 domain-containing protein n=1 Tax=Parnassius mnemosyne TaxID=213953 RepID=A0AAV1KTP5_9NEOP